MTQLNIKLIKWKIPKRNQAQSHRLGQGQNIPEHKVETHIRPNWGELNIWTFEHGEETQKMRVWNGGSTVNPHTGLM